MVDPISEGVMVDTTDGSERLSLAGVAAVESAAEAEDLFGDLGPATNESERLRALAARFRDVARSVHPDRHPAARASRAHAAFVKASRLRDAAEAAIRVGTYGTRRPASPPTQMVTSRTRSYRVESVVARGDLCDLHACSYETKGAGRALFKIVLDPHDGDLLENEANVLRTLFPPSRAEEKFLRYLPRLRDSFLFSDEADGTTRRVVVLPRFDEHVSLGDVMRSYPRGLDFRDAAWMLKRLLVVLGFVHRRGFVHGAVLPPHLLVHPVDHGARLIDWCYAVPSGGRVRALSVAHRDLYAPEVPAKEPATSATDIFMAARSALALMGDAAPPALRRFLETCLARSPRRRPDDAWKLHDELDALLRRLVGPPSYRPLRLPNQG